jgi:PadR family transcriptional regulator PadR
MKKTNPPFLNGVPELLVLQLLARREMYGYEIVKAIQTLSQEAFAFGEGCIYPYLHWLEETKLVKSRRADARGRTRNYYRLTSGGRKRLEALTAEWKRVAQGVSLIVGVQHV